MKRTNARALVMAIIELSQEHKKRLKNKEIESPYYKTNSDVNLWKSWEFIRIESLIFLFNNKESNLWELVEETKQEKYIDLILKEFNLATQDDPLIAIKINEIKVNIKNEIVLNIWNMYKFIFEMALNLGSKYSNIKDGNHFYIPIFNNFLLKLKEQRAKWIDFHKAVKNNDEKKMIEPFSILEILFNDVTEISKDLALCHVLGPMPNSTLVFLENKIKSANKSKNIDEKETEKELLNLRSDYKKFLEASTPQIV
ncbi:hypothetical protein FIT62_01730 [Candidatus Methylopumilus rimovensis]|nr:hypothetical protein FIT62_01730 [Candidatus Methylopumilus rimovensis]